MSDNSKRRNFDGECGPVVLIPEPTLYCTSGSSIPTMGPINIPRKPRILSSAQTRLLIGGNELTSDLVHAWEAPMATGYEEIAERMILFALPTPGLLAIPNTSPSIPILFTRE